MARMDVLMILLASLGVGFLTIGTGSVAKDVLSKMNDEAERPPIDTSKLKGFLKTIALYLLVFLCLNVCILIIAIILGKAEMSDSVRSTIIDINLILSIPITWFILRKKTEDR